MFELNIFLIFPKTFFDEELLKDFYLTHHLINAGVLHRWIWMSWVKMRYSFPQITISVLKNRT